MNTNLPAASLPEILLVDDNPENLRLLSAVLSKQGYKVKKTINGALALRSVEVAKPDLILLDIQMPGMNGYELCQKLKSQEQTADIPVIFISALDEVFDKVKAFEVGGVDYINKPFQVQEVLVRVKNQLTISYQQKQLIKQQKHLAQAQKVAHIGSWEFDLATEQITWSDEIFRIYGLDPGQATPTLSEHRQKIHPEDRTLWDKTISQLARGNSCKFEFRILRPDNSIRHLFAQGEPIFNGGTQVQKLFGTVLDISDRVAAQERERLVGAIALKMHQSLKLDEILNTTVTEIRQFLASDRVLIYRFNPDWSGGVAVESVGADWMPVLNTTIHDPCFGSYYAQLYQQGWVRAIANIYTADLTPCHMEFLARLQVVASLTVPILQGEKLWALLIVHHCRGERHWQSCEIELLQKLATQVAIALQQSELYSRVQVELIERQRIERELRVSEERYRSVVTAMSEGIVLQQADGRIITCNASAESILGLSVEQMQGKTSIDPCWQAIRKDGSPFPGELHPAMVTLRTGEPQSNVIMGIYKPDGSLIWISINSQPLFQPGETKAHAVVTSFSDITDRKHAEKALRESEHKFRAVFDSVQDGILIADDNGYFLDANPTACALLGLCKEELVGRSVTMFAEQQKALETQNLWQSFLVQGQIKGEFTFDLGDGTLRDIEYSVIANFLPGRHLAVFHDITDRKRTETALRKLSQQEREKAQQLEQALKALQRTQAKLVQNEKMVSLGQLVAGVAHEINNPTSFIYGNIYPASEYAQDLLHLVKLYAKHYPEPVAEIAEQIERIEPDFIAEDFPKLLASMKEGTHRISEIVQSLRNFSRLDEMDCKQVDIHEGIENTLFILKHRLTQQPECSEIQVIKEYGELPKIECYPGQLNQVFMNILSNAIDALEGLVRWKVGSFENSNQPSNVQTFKPSNPTIRIHTEVIEENWVVIRIADNGPGLTAEVQSRIFDPFFTTKPPGKGTGLGLSISYQIVVDKHRGQLSCHSVLGLGAEFVIELPIARCPLTHAIAPSTLPDAIANGKTANRVMTPLAQTI
jgi:PAS domain S-box-containing protein